MLEILFKNSFNKQPFLLIISWFIHFVICIMWITYNPYHLSFQYTLNINFFDLYINFGIDGLSFFFIYLISFLLPLCQIHIYYTTSSELKNLYGLSLFSISILLMIVFCSLDLIIFYIFFEAILVPFFAYIGISGYRKRRIHASFLLFFYTLVGSLFMLVSIFSLYLHCGTTDLEIVWLTEYNLFNKYLIWLAFFFSFAIKVPMFPFHIWLPEAHVEAPTEGSVFLAAILLKLGTYGFLRFLFPIFPDVTIYFSPLVLLLASLSVFYTSLTTLRQVDVKKIIAYSSVAHMNVCMIGLFSFHITSLNGSVFLMLGHGVVSSGLFFVIGFLYNRYYTKIIKYYSGIVQTMPLLSIVFFFFTLGNISMPLTSNFVGELLILIGTYNVLNFFPLFLVGFSIFICSIYSLWLYNKVVFLMPKKEFIKNFFDLSFLEISIITPLILFMFLLGIYPNPFFQIISPSITYNFIEILTY
ncbi:MAG: nad4 [Haloplasmataceae bacterium]|nr:nad4 [Haloplasmataceae bacterium]